ncbi:hypothetical protein [Synoicihabitans lomoniglobus]|uniref:Uncharacterized protein n=1 Tax=Synoicihabitans lomoniglobus TaxID=2909285 RepID=A0AAF0CPQ7_9BACT|nr:hypothetical protein [Opitutaceae bacterium LMO-M01]WED65784.1 hypothetical protein PXH66_02850 [Opitutaceae bacterium LMO-M01]
MNTLTSSPSQPETAPSYPHGAPLFSGEDHLFHSLMEADVIVRQHLLAAMCSGDLALQERLQQRLDAVGEIG